MLSTRVAWLLGAVAVATPPPSVPPTARAPTDTCAPGVAGAHNGRATQAQLDALFAYIHDGWRRLQRGNHELLQAARDDKHPRVDGKWAVYVADDEPVQPIRDALKAQLSAQELAHLTILPLKARKPDEHGILYLPHPYVVPGGRFNEMYAWDSYYIVLGLLRDGQIELARGMVDNALYEVVHYGTFLNANRSYYLTRSQPPQLAGMLLAVYDVTHDDAWLRRALPAVEKYYRYWHTRPHATRTGLSRYHDTGKGPAPEVVFGEVDAHGQGAYERVKAYYRHNAVADYDVRRFYDAKHDALRPAYFIGDRSMRESGFDPSQRFGPFNADVADYNPVCLNTLLYAMEGDMARIYGILGDAGRKKQFDKLARTRAERVQRVSWDDPSGLFLDYNFRTGKRRNYPFATTFYPLWAGLATPEQARRVTEQLRLLEAPGGLLTSTTRSGTQWDAPYGWAPLQLLAVRGLRRYGFHDDANRLSIKFLSLVLRHFVERGAVFEKYDVVDRGGADVAAGLAFGYTSNEVGFGWTNAVFLELYAELPEALRPQVLELTRAPSP